MLNFSNTQRVKIWKIDKKNNYAEVRMGSSRKEKDSKEYKNSTWSFTRFVGTAFKKIDELSVDDTIVLKGAGIKLEPYTDNEGNVKYPKFPQLVVFNWEPFAYEDSGQTSSGTKPPTVVSSDDEELPF